MAGPLSARPWRQEKEGAAARPVPAPSPPDVTSPPAFGFSPGYGHRPHTPPGAPPDGNAHPAPMGPQRRGGHWLRPGGKSPNQSLGVLRRPPAHQEPLRSLLISHPKSQGMNALGRHHFRQSPSGARSWGGMKPSEGETTPIRPGKPPATFPAHDTVVLRKRNSRIHQKQKVRPETNPSEGSPWTGALQVLPIPALHQESHEGNKSLFVCLCVCTLKL